MRFSIKLIIFMLVFLLGWNISNVYCNPIDTFYSYSQAQEEWKEVYRFDNGRITYINPNTAKHTIYDKSCVHYYTCQVKQEDVNNLEYSTYSFRLAENGKPTRKIISWVRYNKNSEEYTYLQTDSTYSWMNTKTFDFVIFRFFLDSIYSTEIR